MMLTTSVRLDHDLDPLIVGAATGMLWSRDGLVMAGVGEALRIPIERPTGALAAQEALAALAGSNDVGLPGSGVVAFASLPFDREAPGELIVPCAVVVRGSQRRRWILATGISVGEAIEQATAAGDVAPPSTEIAQWSITAPVAPASWRDDVVAPTRDLIASGALSKVVLARELVAVADQPIDVGEVLRRLHQNFGTAMVFAVDGFIGASPELLVGRVDDVVHAHPLAGTAPRSSDPSADSRLASALVGSAKDRHEHRLTIDWLLDTLLPFCSYVDAEPEPTIVSLANVHHLGTRVEGRLSSPPTSILELVAALHPTPAVGGDPQGAALRQIAAIEPGERGRYAGPVGWVDGAGNGEFAVGIRSGTISANRASIWAGVGVVADSDPEAELGETRSKFQAMMGALVRP